MSIYWLTGNSGAGKTTLAKKLKTKDTVVLDGDEVRDILSDGDLSEEGRRRQGIRVAKLAKNLSEQGFNVIVSVICPYEDLRREIKTMTGCKFIYLEGGKTGKDYPYEVPKNPDVSLNDWRL